MSRQWRSRSVPSAVDLQLPTLRAISALGGRGFHKDISAVVIEAEDLHDIEDQDKLLKNLTFARSQLKAQGYIDNPNQECGSCSS